MNLSKAAKITRVSNAVAAGSSDVNCTSVDMKGFDAVQFVVCFGTLTASAATGVHAQGSDDDSTYVDLVNTSISIADTRDDDVLILDLAKPTYRYIRCVIDRATANAVVDSAIALQYLPATEPVTHDSASVAGSEFHHGSVSGTA